MYCNKCGKEISDNSKFCKHCGNEIKRVNKNAVKKPPIDDDDETLVFTEDGSLIVNGMKGFYQINDGEIYVNYMLVTVEGTYTVTKNSLTITFDGDKDYYVRAD